MEVVDPRWKAVFDKADQLDVQETSQDLQAWKRRAETTGAWSKLILGLVGIASIVVIARGRA